MTKDDLLPPNATSQERNIVLSQARLANLPVAIDTLWDPDTCPEALLPWLAWSLSVDTWDTTWPVQRKRDVIKQSVFVHLKKGTVAAVKAALSLLSQHIRLTEWFTYQGGVHTFMLTSAANHYLSDDNPIELSPTFYTTVKKHVDTVKPLRSHYQLRLSATLSTQIGIQTMLYQHQYLPQRLVIKNERSLQQGLMVAAVIRILQVISNRTIVL